MKPLLVGSVFGPTVRNKVWLKLQQQFLKKTTDSFDYVAYLNNADRDLFSEVKVIGYSTTEWKGNLHPHANALNRILSYFRKHPYRYYLILDSDCFPVTRGWLNMLTSQMEVGGWKIAAPIRTENLDLFPHPCAFFINGEAIHDLAIDFKPKSIKNLLGWGAWDPGTAIPLEKCFPLLRSNVYNPHPLFAGIYHDLFYHHACGSRVPHSRLLRSGYLHYRIPQTAHARIEKDLYRGLIKNPSRFIKDLMRPRKK